MVRVVNRVCVCGSGAVHILFPTPSSPSKRTRSVGVVIQSGAAGGDWMSFAPERRRGHGGALCELPRPSDI